MERGQLLRNERELVVCGTECDGFEKRVPGIRSSWRQEFTGGVPRPAFGLYAHGMNHSSIQDAVERTVSHGF